MSKWEHCPGCAFSAGHAERCRYYGTPVREAIAAARQEKAERIARQVVDGINAAALREYGGGSLEDANPNALKIATAAALAALTEKENAS